VRVRLTRKLAEEIDGVDLTGHSVGDILDLPVRDARLLVAECWASPERRGVAEASDRMPRRRRDDPAGPRDPGES
jgi:hypothetical protein